MFSLSLSRSSKLLSVEISFSIIICVEMADTGPGTQCDLTMQGNLPWHIIKIIGPAMSPGMPDQVIDVPILRSDTATTVEDLKQIVLGAFAMGQITSGRFRLMGPEWTPGLGPVHLWKEITVATYIEWGWIRGALRVVSLEEPANPVDALVGSFGARFRIS